MKKKIAKRLASTVLALGMIASMMPASFAAASDISGHWAESTMKSFVDTGLLSGYGNGQYGPNDPMSRAQLAVLINRLAGLTAESAAIASYTDVSPSDWHYKDLAKALAAGYMAGTSQTTLSPNAPVTREQGFVMLARYMKLDMTDASVLNAFTYADSIAPWARGGVAAMVSSGYVHGSDGKLQPGSTLTRAEGTTVLNLVGDVMKSVSLDETAPPSSPAPNDNKNQDGGSGHSGGSNNGGSNSGGNSQTPTEAALVKASETKLVDLGWIQYVSIAFEEGYSKENTKVKIDGVDVTAAVTKVTDDGSIAKWELTGLNPAKLEVISNADTSKTQAVTLSGKAPTTPTVQTNTAPSYILTHGAIPVWDYHLTNYDVNGQVRITPSKTTFGVDAVTSATPSYSPDAELKQDEAAGNPYHVSGAVEILFHYSTPEQKAWFDGIPATGALALLDYNETNSVRNDRLLYEKSENEHHGNPVGVLTIQLGQSNFFSNGRYNVRVKSDGGKTVIAPIHVVNEKAPSLQVSGTGAIKSGQKLNFTVKDMTYAITNPIETVKLTDPTGAARTLEYITDWYLIGDLFVLYSGDIYENDSIKDTVNNIPYNGEYTMTVYSNGFKPMEKAFTVTGGEDVPAKAAGYAQIDAFTGATSGGSGGSSGGGGGPVMAADLLFNADLLANALILEELGVEHAAASAIVDRWAFGITAADAVYGEDGEIFYTWTGYYDAVQTAKTSGQYLTFAAYAASENAETTPNRPYAVKEVLEDNLLGETQYNGSYKGKNPPVLKLQDNALHVSEGQPAVLTTADTEYLGDVTEVRIKGFWKALTENTEYTIDTEEKTLTIKASVLELGDNDFVIKAEGYKDSVVRIVYQKNQEANATELSLDKDVYTIGDSVVVTSAGETGDYFKDLVKVELTRPNHTTTQVLPGDQASVFEEIGYTVDGNKFTLGKDLFKTAGDYTLIIRPKYYEAQTRTIQVKAAEEPADPNEPELKEPPANAPAITKDLFGDYSVKFGMGHDAWAKVITGVSVNGTSYRNGSPWNDDKYSVNTTDALISLGNKDFTLDANVVVITAAGYTPLTLTISKDGQLVTSIEPGGGDNEPGDSQTGTPAPTVKSFHLENKIIEKYYRVTFHEESSNATELEKYLKSTSLKVTLDGTPCSKVTMFFGGKEYKLSKTSYAVTAYLDFSEACFGASETVNVVIKADGYQDLTFTIQNQALL